MKKNKKSVIKTNTKTKVTIEKVSLKSSKKMQSIHIFGVNTKSSKELMITFYKYFLKNDPNFFYVLEPDLIIRCGLRARKAIIKQLKLNGYRYDVYDYPKAPKKWMFDDKDEKLLDIILPIHHLFAVANLTLSCKQFHRVRERVFHIANNMHFLSSLKEADIYLDYANFRLKMGLIQNEETKS